MEKYIINGGNALSGEVSIKAAKNSVLCLMSCAVLTDEQVILHNCPKISDVLCMCEIIEKLGGTATWQEDSLILDCSKLCSTHIDCNLTAKMRSSIFLLGPILAKHKYAETCYPGGCNIGLRPIDLHLLGLQQLGAVTIEQDGLIKCSAEQLHGNTVQLSYPSVGATENIMMAASLAHGRTVIKNAAKEPEICDLARMINLMGGKIYGSGSGVIVIEGVERLHGCDITPIPDRIVAGTYMLAAAITGGNIVLNGAKEEHIFSLIVKLRESACKIWGKSGKIYIEAPKRCKSAKIIETSPYPGFPTDLQAQILALQTVSDGMCILQENLFETRFRHVDELRKMGADITVKGKLAIIKGVQSLSGAEMTAHDLRGGAALVLAALAASGCSVINGLCHIERGYSNLSGDLVAIGADIKKIYRE